MKSPAEISIIMPSVASRMSTGNSKPPIFSLRMKSIDSSSVTSEPISARAFMNRLNGSSTKAPKKVAADSRWSATTTASAAASSATAISATSHCVRAPRNAP